MKGMLLVAVLALVALAMGCDVQGRLSPSKEQYLREIESWTAWYDARMAGLRARLEQETGQARARLAERIQGLDVQRDELVRRLEQLRSRGSEAWQDLRPGIDQALHGLERAYREATQGL